jgi:hypothetical protein
VVGRKRCSSSGGQGRAEAHGRRELTGSAGAEETETPQAAKGHEKIALYPAAGVRAMTLISKSKPASQVAPTTVQFGHEGANLCRADGHHGLQLCFGIGVRGRDVHDIVEGAYGRLQDGLQIGECAADLVLEYRLGRTVVAAADLTGNERQIAGTDRL